MAGRRKKKKRKPSLEAPNAPKAPPERQAARSKSPLPPRLLVALTLGIVILAVGHFRWRWSGRSFAPKPLNIILVTADTLRADKLGAYGSTTVETPNLDRLAASGVLFENASTSTPLTLPAHATLFTGTYPIYHGVRDNGGYYLEPSQVTLAESLQARGYATGAFVGAFVLDARFGLDQGFDRYFDDFDLSTVDNAALNSVYRRGDEVLAEAIAWMKQRDKTAPFFSWIHLYDAHRPYDPPEPFKSQYRNEPWGSYDGEVAYVDALMGELVAWLEDEELIDTTIVVFVADHGESLGDHEELTHGFFIYDATMRVPFIVSAPYAALRARRVSAQVRTIDLMPTLLELVGSDVPDSVQGSSLVPILTGRRNQPELTALGESLLPEHYGWSPLASLRTNDFHYIEAPRPELYDLRNDPSERTNLASRRAATVHELQAELDDLRDRYGAEDTDERSRAVVDPETRDKLAALGYLGGDRSPSRDPSRPPSDPKDKIGLFKLIREASNDSDEGKPQEAVAKLQRVIDRDPEIPEAYNILGNVHAESGERAKAVAAYREALALDPQYKPALFSLALSFKEMGRLDEAAIGFERILELDPHASQASFLLADIEIDRQRFDEVHAILERVTTTNDRERALVHHLEARRHLGRDEIDAAESELRRAIEIDPKLPTAHYDLGLVLEERGAADAALEAYTQEIAIAPESFRSHFNLAKLLGDGGRHAEMMDHLEKAIDANPDFAVGHLYLANAYLEEGNLERAMQLAQRGIELRPEPSLAPFGHFILADVFHRLGRAGDAAREMALAQKLQGS